MTRGVSQEKRIKRKRKILRRQTTPTHLPFLIYLIFCSSFHSFLYLFRRTLIMFRRMKSSPGQLPQIKSKPFRTCERDTSKNSMNEEQQLEHISSSKYVSQQRCKTRDIIHCFQKKGIKMIALDFDKTILSIHTYGRYQGTAETLVEHVRSTFHYLIEGILNSPGFGKNLFLCIVTFSPQESLIRKLLAVLFQTR